MDTVGLDSLPVDLQEVAHLRIQHPDYSIQQLATVWQIHLPKAVSILDCEINKIADELKPRIKRIRGFLIDW